MAEASTSNCTDGSAQPMLNNLLDELLRLDDADGAIENVEAFDCEICTDTIAPGDGIVLRACLHVFCKECMKHVITLDLNVDINCPSRICDGHLQEREIRALVPPNEYDKYMQKGVRAAQSTIRGTVLCQLADCTGWCICDDSINEFDCPVCQKRNCIPCKAIHPGRNCTEYQEDFAVGDADGAAGGVRRTAESIKTMITNGEAMRCPKCGILIMKREGCDWLMCSMCRVEICWAVRGSRWGPKGKGDTSAGCRCGIDGRKCTPECGFCH